MTTWGLPEASRPHQIAALWSDAKFTLQSGAYGSGKTLTNAWIILRECLTYPGCYGMVGAETLGQLRETLQRRFDQLIEPLLARGHVKFHGNHNKYTFANGSEVIFMSLAGSSPQAMKERLKSHEFSFAIIEEATAISQDTMEEIFGRTRNAIGSRQIWASCNPDGPEHYLYDWFFRNPKPGYKVVTSNSYDNPDLPHDYIKMLEDTLGELQAQRYLRGEWVSSQGMVYPEFNRETHTYAVKPYGNPVKRFGGLDFGGANPHCMLWLEEDAQGYVYVIKEWYKAAVPLSQIAAAIHTDPVSPIYCDHDVADRLTLDRDFRIKGLTKARKDVSRGIAMVTAHLKPVAHGLPPRLRIHKSCVNLIRELGNYRYPNTTGPRDPASNNPIKKDDHSTDALYMALLTHYGKGQGMVATFAEY